MMDSIYDFFLGANKIGLWPALSALSAVGGLVLAMNYIRTKSYTRGLNFYIAHSREEGTNFPNKIIINIRNYTGGTVVITNPYFKFGKTIIPDDNATCDSYSKEYEIKFEDSEKRYLNEVDIMLRHKEKTITFIPADPKESDAKIEEAIESHNVGILYCNVIWLEDRPKIIRVRKKI
ncbi:MAG: hypothetical protein K9L87_04885 [Candidatus Omnitrophica bacterium]|nr:hypothetical protein [Candidatus Omnitrophota bacterium]MCF7909914.1 hypothetical protein [Candidatus Omnitrophota bacterium]